MDKKTRRDVKKRIKEVLADKKEVSPSSLSKYIYDEFGLTADVHGKELYEIYQTMDGIIYKDPYTNIKRTPEEVRRADRSIGDILKANMPQIVGGIGLVLLVAGMYQNISGEGADYFKTNFLDVIGLALVLANQVLKFKN
jgi:hypothetical protein